MVNINSVLFKRYKPANKLAIIKDLTVNELLAISSTTIRRIIKEVGEARTPRSKFKTVYFTKAVSNNRNSTINYVYNWKNDKIFFNVYIQGDDTDTCDDCDLSSFLNTRYEEVICGTLKETFLNGYSHEITAYYNKKDRAEVIRELLYTYVHLKYKKDE